MNLCICGNGFDCNHNLETEYYNYRKYLEKHNETLLFEVENFSYFRNILSIDKSSWSDLEQALSFSYENYIKDKFGLNYCNSSFRRYNQTLSPIDQLLLCNDIQRDLDFIGDFTGYYFKKWLSDTYKNELILKEGLIEKDSYFITFNYTSLLEDLYDVKKEKIFYIHGRLNDVNDYALEIQSNILTYQLGEAIYKDINNNTPVRDTIQFGSNENMVDEVRFNLLRLIPDNIMDGFNINNIISNVEKFCEFSYKSILANIERLDLFIEPLEIDRVIIMGHSIMGIDKEYYENVLVPQYRNLPWVFYFWNEEEKQKQLEFIEEFGIKDWLFKSW